MFVCICDFCACVCVCMFVRVCVRAQQACYYAVYVSSFIMFSSLITESANNFACFFMSFVSFYKLQYSAPFVSGSLSLSLTFFLSGFSLLCVILRNTHIHTYTHTIYCIYCSFTFSQLPQQYPLFIRICILFLAKFHEYFNRQFKGQ